MSLCCGRAFARVGGGRSKSDQTAHFRRLPATRTPPGDLPKGTLKCTRPPSRTELEYSESGQTRGTARHKIGPRTRRTGLAPSASEPESQDRRTGGGGGSGGGGVQPPYGGVWCAGQREQAHVSTRQSSSVVPQAPFGSKKKYTQKAPPPPPPPQVMLSFERRRRNVSA